MNTINMGVMSYSLELKKGQIENIKQFLEPVTKNIVILSEVQWLLPLRSHPKWSLSKRQAPKPITAITKSMYSSGATRYKATAVRLLGHRRH